MRIIVDNYKKICYFSCVKCVDGEFSDHRSVQRVRGRCERTGHSVICRPGADFPKVQ